MFTLLCNGSLKRGDILAKYVQTQFNVSTFQHLLLGCDWPETIRNLHILNEQLDFVIFLGILYFTSFHD